MKLLAPSLLSADFLRLGEQVREIEKGGAGVIHCDIMDGHFVPNLTFGPLIVSKLRKFTTLPLDVHLMIKNPDALIPEFIKAGADYITVHIEEVVHLHRTIQNIKSQGVKAGVAINPGTSMALLEEIYPYIDLLLIMSVNPGFGGQKFIETTLNKIRVADKIRKENNYDFAIEVDGGIDKNTIGRVNEAGCNIFVAGNAVFSNDNAVNNCLELKNMIKE